MELSDWLFGTGAVTMGSLNSDAVTLVNEGSDYSVTVGLGNYKVLSLWSAPESTYVCIEPWTSLPSRQDIVEEFTCKSDMLQLAANKTYETTWSICVR
jgi:galactose mutarotase-like enzyme